MLNYWGMIALGLACENVAMLVGQPWTGLWLIFWVITNVSTAFYDIDIEPAFYKWGYAWPLHSGKTQTSFSPFSASRSFLARFNSQCMLICDSAVVEGSRQILFNLHSRIGLDFGILIAWGAVNTALFPLCCYWMRYKNNHGLHEYWA
jgi:hypothetical protein